MEKVSLFIINISCITSPVHEKILVWRLFCHLLLIHVDLKLKNKYNKILGFTVFQSQSRVSQDKYFDSVKIGNDRLLWLRPVDIQDVGT